MIILLLLTFVILTLPVKEKKNLALTELEISRLAAIAKILKDTSHYHSSKFSDVDIALLLQLLKSWPVEMMFPGKLCNWIH